MKIGVDYYPENWDSNLWHRDAEIMAKSGVQVVRIGGLGWSGLEPRSGQFNTGWLDEVIKTLPELIKYNDKTRLLIVGGSLFTDYLDELKALTENLGLSERVIFTGLIEHTELPKYISAMDVCIIPLKSEEWYGISMSNKFFEYSACAKPVLIKPAPGIMALGWDNTFVYENNEQFVERIKYIMDNPREYAPDVSEYSWYKRADDIEKELFKLLDEKGKKVTE